MINLIKSLKWTASVLLPVSCARFSISFPAAYFVPRPFLIHILHKEEVPYLLWPGRAAVNPSSLTRGHLQNGNMKRKAISQAVQPSYRMCFASSRTRKPRRSATQSRPVVHFFDSLPLQCIFQARQGKNLSSCSRTLWQLLDISAFWLAKMGGQTQSPEGSTVHTSVQIIMSPHAENKVSPLARQIDLLGSIDRMASQRKKNVNNLGLYKY